VSTDRLVIYGIGGHGRTLLDLVRTSGRYTAAGYVDDRHDDDIDGLPWLGDHTVLPKLVDDGIVHAVNGVGGISRIETRIEAWQRLLDAGLACPTLVHPSAVVEPTSTLGRGAQVLALAYVGAGARLGEDVLLNTGAQVNHDCVLGDHVGCSPGALLAGGVTVGDRALIGMGVTVNVGVHIGAGARIGNGATVVADVPDGGIVRAGARWPSPGDLRENPR
jgi:sugar O-acyltransferase (sialic acid O-acetyltransferase NeuD family)